MDGKSKPREIVFAETLHVALGELLTVCVGTKEMIRETSLYSNGNKRVLRMIFQNISYHIKIILPMHMI